MTEETNLEFNTTGSSGGGQEQEQSKETADTTDNSSDEKAADTEPKTDGDATDKEQDSQGESEKEDKADSEQEAVEINLPEDSIVEDKEAFMNALKGATESQEGFDKLMEQVKELGEKAQEKAEAESQAAWENTLTKWEGELKSDEDFGKDYEANTKSAMEVAEDIGLASWLKDTGFDKNPDVLKAMLKVHTERSDAAIRMGRKAEAGHPKNADGTHKIVFDSIG